MRVWRDLGRDPYRGGVAVRSAQALRHQTQRGHTGFDACAQCASAAEHVDGRPRLQDVLEFPGHAWVKGTGSGEQQRTALLCRERVAGEGVGEAVVTGQNCHGRTLAARTVAGVRDRDRGGDTVVAGEASLKVLRGGGERPCDVGLSGLADSDVVAAVGERGLGYEKDQVLALQNIGAGGPVDGIR